MTAIPELNSADSLRLNVLLTQKPEAVRIDESRMVVHALTAKGEVSVRLDPNCEADAYIRRVKELLSSQVLDSPGGYPVFLERWTRMGQVRDSILEQLLLLGETEAVVAVAHAPGLTETLARRVWWAMPDAANARQMLKHPKVAGSAIGRELAAFLLEFLPFEQEPGDLLESVRLVLQPGLIDDGDRQALWQKAQVKRSMLVGFLLAAPDALPVEAPAHPDLELLKRSQASTTTGEDAIIAVMRRVLSAPGQTYLQTCEMALARVSDQNVTVALFEAIADYFGQARVFADRFRDVGKLGRAAADFEWRGPPELESYARSIVFLSAIGVELLNPIFARTDAIGSGMRRKIKPVSDPMLVQLRNLGPG